MEFFCLRLDYLFVASKRFNFALIVLLYSGEHLLVASELLLQLFDSDSSFLLKIVGLLLLHFQLSLHIIDDFVDSVQRLS